jgi:hypothetical protein
VVGWIQSLYDALNGATLPMHPVDPPSHFAAVVPKNPVTFARAAAAGVAGMIRAPRYRGAPLEPPSQKLAVFAPMAMLPVRVQAPASSLVRAARARKTTLGTLLFASVALALRRVTPGSEDAFIRARQSIALREQFPGKRKRGDGNSVSTFLVDVEPRGGLDAMFAEIDAETKHAIDRFASRETMLRELVSEMQTWLGRKLLGHVALGAKKRNKLPAQSFHLSNLGRIEGFDNGAVPVEAIIPCLQHTNLFVAAIGFRGHLQLTFNYPRGEMTETFIRALIAELDRLLLEVAETGAGDAPAKSSAAV